MYKTWGTDIEEVEVSRTTKKCVFIINDRGGEYRYDKVTNYSSYFETEDEARQHIISKVKEEVERAERRLKQSQEKLQTAMNGEKTKKTLDDFIDIIDRLYFENRVEITPTKIGDQYVMLFEGLGETKNILYIDGDGRGK